MNTDSFFESYFANAALNSIIVMDTEGVILRVNQAFRDNFGYSDKDLKDQNFSMLFTPTDLSEDKPQKELQEVIITGQAQDENYVVNKAGKPVWAIGECMLVSDDSGKQFIVKDIVNLQAKRQLQLFLLETEELLERIYDSAKDVPILVLDGSMKVIKANEAFMALFEFEEALLTGGSFSGFNHDFWRNAELKSDITKMIVSNQAARKKEYVLNTRSGQAKVVQLDSRIIEKKHLQGRSFFIMFEELAR